MNHQSTKCAPMREPGIPMGFGLSGLPSGRTFPPMEETRSEKYRAYLQSRKWKEKRNAVFQREGGICQGCKEEPIEHVHHTTYAHIYDELLFELIGLCETCHRRVHFREYNAFLNDEH